MYVCVCSEPNRGAHDYSALRTKVATCHSNHVVYICIYVFIVVVIILIIIIILVRFSDLSLMLFGVQGLSLEGLLRVCHEGNDDHAAVAAVVFVAAAAAIPDFHGRWQLSSL